MLTFYYVNQVNRDREKFSQMQFWTISAEEITRVAQAASFEVMAQRRTFQGPCTTAKGVEAAAAVESKGAPGKKPTTTASRSGVAGGSKALAAAAGAGGKKKKKPTIAMKIPRAEPGIEHTPEEDAP